MDPLIIHHVIRHPLSRIETSNFQDKSGCSINGIRSFLFGEGIVRNLEDMERFTRNEIISQDYRGYPTYFEIYEFDNYPLSDEILNMKNVTFDFQNRSEHMHKRVSPEPHFVEEERNLIENHFKYLEPSYESEDIEEWYCFEMDNEGHLVTLRSYNTSGFQLSNESIEHLSNFPHLSDLEICKSTAQSNIKISETTANLSLLSNLKSLSVIDFWDPELLKDLGLFSNLLSLNLKMRKTG